MGLSAAPAAARVDLGAQHIASPTELWVIGVDRHNVAALTDRFALRARRARVNALVIDWRGLTRRQSKRVQRLVKRFGFRAIVLPHATTMSSSCAAGRQTDSTALCTLRAGSLSSARRLASSPNVDLVVVRLKHLPSTASVKAIGDVHATVLVLVEIGRRRSLNRNAWQKVIREAAGERSFVLGVVPVASDRVRALDAYVGLLGKTPTPPSEPDGLVLASASRNSLRVQWTRVSSVSKYGVYRDSGLVKSVNTNSATLSGLACGTSYLVEVDAADKAGRRSAKASLSARTTACADASPPTSPSALAVSAATDSSLTLSWSGSLDDVGVIGYGVYKGLVSAGSTPWTSYTLTGLACGTSYTLAVDAFDAAGNRSGKATQSASTSACVDTSPPTKPAGLAAIQVTQTSVKLTWSASSDNVGVTGYGRYENGSLVSSGTETSYTFSALACGTSYTLAVDAHDAVGNDSVQAWINASTSACSPPPPSASTTTSTSTTSTASTTSTTSTSAALGRKRQPLGGRKRRQLPAQPKRRCLQRCPGLRELRGRLQRCLLGRYGRGHGHARLPVLRRRLRRRAGRRAQNADLPW